jgi:hypothetical protein
LRIVDLCFVFRRFISLSWSGSSRVPAGLLTHRPTSFAVEDRHCYDPASPPLNAGMLWRLTLQHKGSEAGFTWNRKGGLTKVATTHLLR